MENQFENDYIERYVKKVGFLREKNNKSKKIFSMDKVRIYANFGDLPSCMTFGNIIFPNIQDDQYYNIVLTWKGLSVFFPHADEVWSLDKGYILGDFYEKARGLTNDSHNLTTILRSLNEHFVGVVDQKTYSKYYGYTLSSDFYKDFPKFQYQESELLSLIYLPSEFRNNWSPGKQKSCVLMPYKHTRHINSNTTNLIRVDQQYYLELLRRLEQHGTKVFCLQNGFTYDMSSVYSSNNILYIKEESYLKILSIIHHVGCYFDFFSDVGDLGLLASANLFRVVERGFYFTSKKYVEDRIMSFGKQIKNIFTFLYFSRKDNDLNAKFFEHIINQFDQFFEMLPEQKIEDKTVLQEKEVRLLDLSRHYIKKLSPKFISICKGKNHG